MAQKTESLKVPETFQIKITKKTFKNQEKITKKTKRKS